MMDFKGKSLRCVLKPQIACQSARQHTPWRRGGLDLSLGVLA
ncbi:hypothetical protein Y880_02528 [Pseudomonas aeruginosa PAK]|nr:hypothetical protein Y880_02528 [Pseudomonas aeruginosa PAK]